MKCYKGTDINLKCRGFQYEVGKTYETPEARICETGFHACEIPLDVLHYYPPNTSRYFDVELDTNGQARMDDSKRVGSRITIIEEIGINGLVQQHYSYMLSKTDCKNNRHINVKPCSIAAHASVKSTAGNAGMQSVAVNTGDKSLAINEGRNSVAANTGYKSIAKNMGVLSIAANEGDLSAAVNTGIMSAAVNMGSQSAAINTGPYSIAINVGSQSIAMTKDREGVAINTGKYGAAEVTGENSIAIAVGHQGTAKGTKGQWLVLVERTESGKVLDVKAFKVNGVNILPDTFYMLKNGAPFAVDGNE